MHLLLSMTLTTDVISSVLQPNSPQAMVQVAIHSANKTRLVQLFPFAYQPFMSF